LFYTTLGFIVLLALTTVAYYLFPLRLRWWILLTSSVVFYSFFGLYNAVCFSATILTTYLAALLTDYLHKSRDNVLAGAGKDLQRDEKVKIKNKFRNLQRICLSVCLLINIGFLAMVKLDGSLLMPMGLSFYTFRAVGYLIDVYRGKNKAETNLPRFMLFCSFFPQIVLGPISRYDELSQTLFTGNKLDITNLSEGARRVLFGFFKKLVIADRLLPVIRELVTENIHGADVIIVLIMYSVALYCDFSGGIDIALGTGRIFGVRLPENFNKPFLAVSITDFWQRWHITMGSWFRDYLFYPLSTAKPVRFISRWIQDKIGYNIGKRIPVYFITLIVWSATGAWHGVSLSYVGWGLVNGIVIMLSQMCETFYKRFHTRFPNAGKKRWYHAFTIVRTYLLMRVISAFFVFENMGTSIRALLSIFTGPRLSSFRALTELISASDLIVTGAGVALLIILGLQKKDTYQRQRPLIRYAALSLLLLIVLLFGVYGYGFDTEQFIYNRF